MKQLERLHLLEAEYFKLQDIIESFDTRALQIKGWSVTLSLAGLVAAFVNKDAANARGVVILLAILSAICFWVVEFLWKCHQWTLLARVEEIEAALRGESDTIDPLQIATSFKANSRKVILQRLTMIVAPSLCLPHILIVVIGFALAGALPPGPLLR